MAFSEFLGQDPTVRILRHASLVFHQPSQCPWHLLRSAVSVCHSVLGFCGFSIFEGHRVVISEDVCHLGGCQCLLRRFWLCGFMSNCTKGPQVPGGLAVTLTKMTGSLPMPLSLSPSLVSINIGSTDSLGVGTLCHPSSHLQLRSLFLQCYSLLPCSVDYDPPVMLFVVMFRLTRTWMAGGLLHHLK